MCKTVCKLLGEGIPGCWACAMVNSQCPYLLTQEVGLFLPMLEDEVEGRVAMDMSPVAMTEQTVADEVRHRRAKRWKVHPDMCDIIMLDDDRTKNVKERCVWEELEESMEELDLEGPWP